MSASEIAEHVENDDPDQRDTQQPQNKTSQHRIFPSLLQGNNALGRDGFRIFAAKAACHTRLPAPIPDFCQAVARGVKLGVTSVEAMDDGAGS